MTARGKLFLAQRPGILWRLGSFALVSLLATVAGGSINKAIAGHNRGLFILIALAACAGCAVAFRRSLRRSPFVFGALGPLGVSMFRSMHGSALVIGATLLAVLVVLGFMTRQALVK
jgi:hypothetical protein